MALSESQRNHDATHRRKINPEKHTLYSMPLTIPGVETFLDFVDIDAWKQTIIYGEVYGAGVQNLHYDGRAKPLFRAFDILHNGHYPDYNDFIGYCTRAGIPTVPVLYVGPYEKGMEKQYSSGKSTLGDHIREGCVIKPLHERVDPDIGRVILKYVGDEYLLGRKEDFTDA